MLRWEILEVIERDGVLVRAILYRPLGELTIDSDAYQLPFNPGDNTQELISAVLFDGFEPLNQAVVVLPDGSLQKHWTFRLQVID